MIVLMMAGGAALGVVVWVLAKLGKALIKIAEALAAAAVVLFARMAGDQGRGVGVAPGARPLADQPDRARHGGVVAVVGVASLALTAGVVAGVLTGWRLIDLASFDAWAGRHLRAWWLRWTVYAPKLPQWLHACGLSIKPDAMPDGGDGQSSGAQPPSRPAARPRRGCPRCSVCGRARRGTRSASGWCPARNPKTSTQAARALASARAVTRCQVRELTPNVVSIDFQRRNLLADPVACLDLATLADVAGTTVDLRRVFSGRTEYGQDWHVPLAGGHTLVAGSTGAGKNSAMWCPLVSIAPAIRDGLVRVSGIDPKGMELAYGRRIFHRYAVTGTDALAVLDDLVAAMHARKTQFAGQVRSVPISREHPLELVEFDEIGALTKYIDRKTRDAITERVALLTTQGRALGFTVRGYVQEPTKDTVPVRELFPRRICLRVSAKSHVGMVLGDQAYERGAWANRITETEAGVGYVFGEGIREPLRIRAGWVPDQTIKQLETFVTGPITHDTAVLPFPTTPTDPTGSTHGGAA